MSPPGAARGYDPLDEANLRIDPEWTERILLRFLTGETARTGRGRLVVGLSGGLDSAVAAHLGVRALGRDGVVAVLLPCATSSADSLRDARRLGEQLGIEHETVDISPMVDGFVASSPGASRHRLGNVMARCRMTVLFDRSEVHRALVLGTSNKTELMLGYGTWHGDLASALNPLGDLYKTQVRCLAAHLGVPQAILDKPPSADLWPDQSDEEDLGFRYADVDRLLSLLVDARVRPETAAGYGFDAALIERVWGLVVRSQFKRRMPVVAKVSTRSVGWDFRYPRDWLS